VWNVDRSCRACNPEGGGIDIDLHLTDTRRSGGHWASRAMGADGYYANCQCPTRGMLCTGTEPGLPDWLPVGPINNPQLDIDHIRDLPGPENIKVVRAEVGSEFDVGVRHFSGPEGTLVVARVYCGGRVVFESEPVRLDHGGAEGNLWRVGHIVTTAGGCTFTRCGAPGMLTECIRPQDAW
jgi:hypothetical protein